MTWIISTGATDMSAKEVDEISIGATDFKARCLALIDEVARGKTGRVLLMEHNRPVESDPPELWGAMRGTVKVPPRIDLTQATGEVWKADA
jgi:hypothetical protein